MTESAEFLPGDLFSSDVYYVKKSTDLRLCVSSTTQILYIFAPSYEQYIGQSFLVSFEFHTSAKLGDLIERVS